MIFKDPERMRKEFWDLSPYLQRIMCDVDVWCHEHGEQNTWTCLLRTEEEQRKLYEDGLAAKAFSVHNFGRGADMRMLREGLTELLVEYVEKRWGPYDVRRPKIPVAMIHGGTAKHLHIQALT